MKLAKLSPWETYYKELDAMFKWDEDINIVYDEGNRVIKIYVDDDGKASALTALIPAERKFGTVDLKITIIPANKLMEIEDIYCAAFKGNPVVKNIVVSTGVFKATYIVFKCEVVQYFDDNIGDLFGNCSTLYQDIARNIFNQKEGVFFCTDRA